MDKNDVGIKLKRLREQRHLTQEEVAFKLQVSSSDYRDYETGKRYPSDASLMLLLEEYCITEEEFQTLDFINHRFKKKMYSYIQLVLVTLLILAYFLPFHEYTDSLPRIYKNGFAFVFDDPIITGVFFGLLLQVLVLVFAIRYELSSVYKSICVFLSFSSMILLWVVFQGRLASGYHYPDFTLVVFVMLFMQNIIVGVQDIIKHPSGHDFLDDVKKVRSVFLLIFNAILLILYVSALRLTFFDEGYTMILLEKVLILLWTIYHISYIIMLILRRDVLESRLGATIALGIPPVIFSIFIYGFVFMEQGELDSMGNFIILVLYVPVILVNLDYFGEMARSIIRLKK